MKIYSEITHILGGRQVCLKKLFKRRQLVHLFLKF